MRPGSEDTREQPFWYASCSAGPTVEDGSGLAFCTTKTPRTPLGVATLGVPFISIPPAGTNVSFTGTCSNLSRTGEPITIYAGSPHMHKTGVGFRTELLDARGGLKAVISDVPLGEWSFDNQKQQIQPFPRPQFVPGDRIRVTCTYSNPTNRTVTVGEGTDDEMCFDFRACFQLRPPIAAAFSEPLGVAPLTGAREQPQSSIPVPP